MATLNLKLEVKPEELNNVLISLYDDERILSVDSEVLCNDEESEIIYGDNGETYDTSYTIYRIEAEDGTIKYWYDYNDIVNGFIKLGIDCTVFSVVVPESIELDEHIDSEYLEGLNWEFEETFKA